MNTQALWLLLTAIACEVTGTTALKLSHGFTRPIPSVIVVLGYVASFYLLSLSLKHIPIGTAYAIWSGLGIAAITIIGIVLWGESLNLISGIGIVLIIAGAVLLRISLP